MRYIIRVKFLKEDEESEIDSTFSLDEVSDAVASLLDNGWYQVTVQRLS